MFSPVFQKLQAVGARPSASSKEKEFLTWLMEALKGLSLQVSLDEFRAPSTYTWSQIVLWGGLIQAGFLLRLWPWWSLCSALVFLFLEYRELATFPLTSIFFSRNVSHNVVGKKGDSPCFILMAHVDSARTSFFFHPHLVVSPRHSLLLLVVSSCAIPGVALLGCAGGTRFAWLSFPFSLYLSFLILGHVHRELGMPLSPGGNDNGSGVAVALELARLLADGDISFWVVFTGAEESGTWGALQFMKQYASTIRDIPIINLDNVGGGTITVATHEGMWPTYAAPPRLVSSFRKLEVPFPVHFRPYLGLSTDATPLLARGFQAITIIALDEKGIPVNWHWANDSIEAVDTDNLERVVSLVMRWVEEKRNECFRES